MNNQIPDRLEQAFNQPDAETVAVAKYNDTLLEVTRKVPVKGYFTRKALIERHRLLTDELNEVSRLLLACDEHEIRMEETPANQIEALAP